ncbi:hypothetical protein ACFU44_13780 [Nocardia rhizosphaerihabitans]|uniref:hypothetical protein n=1 Tax=Nocardia rhizosphaerihabitans TaxID=1691570 RepID=UPI003671A5AC
MNVVNEKSEAGQFPYQGENESGWYRQEQTGAIVELINDPALGTPLSNAFIKAGYVFAGKTREEAEAVGAVVPKSAAELRKELEEAEARERAEKPLNRQNKEELLATANDEGVEVTEDLDTNRKLADAIQAKRDEGNKE